MDGLIRDIRYAARTLMRAPTFTIVAVLTLAFGIGANTAIFSVVDGVLLRALPYDAPDELVTVWLDMTRRDGPDREWFTPADFVDYRAEPGLFQEMGAWGGFGPTLTGLGTPTVLTGAAVTEGMFERVLRVTPLLGRGFSIDEDRPDGPSVVVLSHSFWQDRFGGDPDALGRSISLSEQPFVIVGIMPEGFEPPFVPNAEVWVPLQVDPSRCGYGCFSIRTVARMQAGMSLDAARERANAVAARTAEAQPAANGMVGASVFALRDDLVRTAEQGLWVLLGAVTFVLLIACTNVANLLLARGAARESEFAVRIALGADRGPILRQLFTESLLLASAGGIIGLGIAAWGTEALLALAPPLTLPGLQDVGMDARILGFTSLIAIGTGLVFGFFPAIRASRADVYSGVRRGGGASNGGQRLRTGLVVTQVGMALMLMVGAGLLLRSFQRLNTAELGFDTEGVLAVSLALPGGRYDQGAERIRFFQELIGGLQQIPGVSSVGGTNSLPLAGNDGDSDFMVEGAAPREATDPAVAWIRRVTPDYFRTMDMQLLDGRGFTDSDDALATRVVIVNETLARRYMDFPARPAVGQRVNFGDPSDPQWRTVVGVAKDTRHFGIRDGTRPAMYFPYQQVPTNAMAMVLRGQGDPLVFAEAARAAISEVDPALAASSIAPLDDLVDSALATDRFVATLLGSFAALALLLAGVGLYGVVSYGVTQRMREMGIRLALGAGGDDVRRLVVRGGLMMTGAGVVLGVIGALAVTQTLESLVYDVPVTDPLTFGLMVAVLTGIALLASWIPARRASRADPVSVLRED